MILYKLLDTHIDGVAMLLEQRMLFGLSQIVGNHLSAHFLRGDLRHPA